MATKKICDYCESEITEKEASFSVLLSSDVTDQSVIDRDACRGCADTLKRLLGKSISRLEKALAAASDR
jgi:hypothetical protein